MSQICFTYPVYRRGCGPTDKVSVVGLVHVVHGVTGGVGVYVNDCALELFLALLVVHELDLSIGDTDKEWPISHRFVMIVVLVKSFGALKVPGLVGTVLGGTMETFRSQLSSTLDPTGGIFHDESLEEGVVEGCGRIAFGFASPLVWSIAGLVICECVGAKGVASF